MHTGLGVRSFKGAPAPLRSISYSVWFQTGVGLPEPSCACMVAGGTAPPSLPAHHREFVYVSLLPSSCQEAPQRGTADYSVIVSYSLSPGVNGVFCVQYREKVFEPSKEVPLSISEHTQQPPSDSLTWTELHFTKQVLEGTIIEIPNRIT